MSLSYIQHRFNPGTTAGKENEGYGRNRKSRRKWCSRKEGRRVEKEEGKVTKASSFGMTVLPEYLYDR